MPIKKTTLLLLLLVAAISALAHTDTLSAKKSYAHMRISFIECGPGLETWETFGHSCLRIVDSSVTGAERDKIYNYGFFEESEGHSVWQQLFTGRVVDLLDTITYDLLMAEYTFKGRSLEELVLKLDSVQAEKVYLFVRDNLQKEKRYYEFSSFYDNCTTRIAELFFTLFGTSFVPGKVIPGNASITFRDLTVGPLCAKQYKYWTGLATNLLYGPLTDKVMTEREALHFPPFLFDALKGATIDGRPIGGQVITMQEGRVEWEEGPDWPFIVFCLFALVTVPALLFHRTRIAGRILSALLLVVTGALGCFLLYTSCFDGEPAWKHNYNVLWALPANLVLPFLTGKIRYWYSFVALVFLFACLFINIFKIQVMPLFELSPLLFCLVCIYSFNCKFTPSAKI